ncbi:hypothetical protein BDL97_09G016100 [Sphagnum fallax]|nr:hypothetical protein BDL97_09G016100 [Sphagnum fallax]
MIMIKHFSKWVELIMLPNKSSHSTSRAFLQQVLSRFRAYAECFTGQGSKFKREFQDLIDHAFIDHHQTSRDHPQIDGLFSPYFLLFGKHPIPPFSITVQMDQVVDLDSPSTWVKVITERVALFRRVMPMAMENLSITQH